MLTTRLKGGFSGESVLIIIDHLSVNIQLYRKKERLHTDSVVNKVPDNPLILHTYPSQAPAGAMDPRMNQVLKSNSHDSQTWKRFSAEQAPWFDLEDLNFCIFHCSAKTCKIKLDHLCNVKHT